jgi:hypothetical protein
MSGRPRAVAGACAATAAFLLFILPAGAHDAIRGIGGKPIHWNLKKIPVVVHPGGDPEIGDGSELLAIRLALSEWQDALGGAIEFTEPSVANPESANTDDLATHRILFDDNNSTGYFPVSTGIVALTPIRYSASNVIVDADIIFNSRDHKFSTALETYHYDVRDVATHEVGHFLGLDHSPLPASTIFPYVEFQQTVHRSLAEDDVNGIRALYKSGPSMGAAGGSVFHNDGGTAGTAVSGAHVSARHADGRTATGTLTRSNGQFTIPLRPDIYQINVAPLDGPMTSDNLVSNVTADESIGCAIAGGASSPEEWSVQTDMVNLGAQLAGPAGPTLESVGSSFPVEVPLGGSRDMYAWGSGLGPGSTMAVPGTTFDITNIVSSAGGHMLSAKIATPADAREGCYDLLVADASGRIAVEAGAIDVRALPPSVLSVSPAAGTVDGGEIISVSGTGFVAASAEPQPSGNINRGSRVIVGGRVVDATVLSPSQLTFVSPGAPAAGSSDVIIINPDGHEGRKVAAFQFTPNPKVSFVFPQAVSAFGGTTLRVHGKDFPGDATVKLILHPGAASSSSGPPIAATSLAVVPSRIDVLVPSLVPGTYDVEVDADGETLVLEGAVVSVGAADPAILQITPGESLLKGGGTVRISGSGFSPGTEVFFGADPATGLGGKSALSVTFISPSALDVAVPPAAVPGATTVLLLSPAGQAATSGFLYSASGGSVNSGGGSGGGGGGGGCAGALLWQGTPPPGPPGSSTGALFSFLLVVAAAFAVRARSVAVRVR